MQRIAEAAIPHRPGAGLVAALDRTAHSSSDELTVIKRLSCDSCILESAEHGLQALTDSWALNERACQRLPQDRRARRPI
ncbi:hypothetical protein THIOKS1220009 [Thiocapsa sp. KS1]|nr:hypothetical protein THIOKS1220009 [Thiocapsa sp. KS1]